MSSENECDEHQQSPQEWEEESEDEQEKDSAAALRGSFRAFAYSHRSEGWLKESVCPVVKNALNFGVNHQKGKVLHSSMA